MSESMARPGSSREAFGAVMARLREKREAALPTRIPRIAREGGAFRLSSGQQRFWFIEQLQPGNPAYNISAAVRFSGPLDVTALRRSLTAIVDRHESLRTTFHEGPQGPVQVVAPAGGAGAFPLPVLDLSSLADPDEEVRSLAREEAALPFDLSCGPLLRVAVLRLGPEEHVLLLTLHHIVSDGWSMAVLLADAQVLYEANVSGRVPDLSELPIQYVDYAAWQHEWLRSAACERQREYWRERLGGLSTVLQLPSDRPRPAVRTPWGNKQFLALPGDLRDALLALARDEKVTPFVLFLAAWDTLLYRLSGQADIPVGTAVANRNRAEVRDLIGFFVNTLVLRAGMRGGMSFRELLRTLSQVALEAFENQELPFDQLVGELQPERQLSHTPLFQAAFAFQNVPMPAWELAGLRLSPLWIDSGTSMFDLTLDLKDQPERIAGWLEYSTDLFDAATVARFAGHLEMLLRGIADNPSRRLSELPLLTVPERQQIREWSSSSARPTSGLLHQRIEAQAARTPEAVAVAAGDGSFTYRELNARANQLARHLRRLGVAPGSLVGLCLDRSRDLMTGLLGTLKTGAAYVPLDPAYPSERWGFMLQDARVQVLLTQEALLPLLPEPAWQVLCLDRDRPLLAGLSPEDLPPAAHLDDLLYVIYTSGSTGRPKGAGVYQRGFSHLLDWYTVELRMDTDDRFLLLSSISFDLTQKNLFAPFLMGGQLHLPPPGPYDPALLIETVGREGITRVNCTPSAFYPLAEREEDFPRLASLRSVILGGEPISLARLERWRRSPYGRAEIVNSYGPTECTDVVSFHVLPPPGVRSTVPVGRPVPGTRLQVLGPGLEPVPLGVAGQLCVGGVCVGMGYLRDARMTAEKFLPDPFAGEPGARLYQTGDLARWLPGGDVEYLGRIDHQVKVRGFRIELGEIEAVLESHPGVGEAVVMAREPAGGEGLRLVGYLSPDPERARPVRELLRLEREGRLDGPPRIELPNGLTIFHQNRAETEFVYRELFEERSYFQHGVTLEDGATVFDVGANIGLFDVFLAREWSDLRIYAFEPLPPIFEVLRLNIELHGVPVRLFQHGIASEAGVATFDYYPHASILSGRFADAEAERETVRTFLLSQLAPGEEVPSEEVLEELLAARLERQSFPCEMKTLSQVIAETGVERIDLLKVDVEKAELDVLLGLAEEDWPKVRQVVAEVHDLDGRLAEITALLERHGFEVAAEQDTALQGIDIYNLYAWRPRGEARPAAPRPSAPEWASPAGLLADVRSFVRERLPEYMVPSAWVLLDVFPLTPSGKVDRKALPDPGSAPQEKDERAFVAPRDLTEEILAQIWAEVLGLPRVGVADNFFDLGGHSLLGTRMVSRVRDALGVELPVRTLFEAPTVEALAKRVEGLRQQEEGVSVPPLVAGPRPERLPLSFAQQRLWFLLQLEPEGVAYHIPAAVRLEGALDPATLAAALGGVVARHEALRTTFEPLDDGAVQVVAAPSPRDGALPLIDLAALPRALREEEALRVARAEVARPFDIRSGPLLRSSLVRLGGREHVLLLVMHHIVSDGWSMGVLVRETVALYRAAALPALPVQYPDFALWQRSWLQGEALESQLRSWRGHLAGAPAVLELPTDRPRSGPSRRGGRVPVRLSAEVLERLGALTRRESATLFMALLAGFCSLLERYTGQDDLVVGTPIANRTRPEIEPLIGFFINTLALRTRLAEGETARELLRRVRAAALEAYAHQDLPFERLVEELSPERHLDHAPLFQVMLTLQNAPGGPTGIPGLRVTPLELANPESKLDWTLTLWESEGGGLEGSFAYKTALWDEATARRIADHWERLLAGLAGAPDDRLSGLPMLSPAELRQLEEWNDSRRIWKEAGSIHAVFERQAARVPDAPAVAFEDRTLRYGELNARANAVAWRLLELGVEPEEPVGICLERSAEVIVALLGVLKSGGAYLPLDPALPRERIRQMLADAGVRVALAGGALRDLLPEEGLRVLLVEEIGTGDGLEDPDLDFAPEQLAYVLFTSGSTGTPRGVGVEHRQLLNYVSGILERLDLSGVESFATVSTLAADLGNTSLFPALLTGRCLHVISKERLSHPEAMAAYFDHHRVDVLKIVPSHLLALETPERPAGPLPRRTLVLGGEASFRDHAERIREAAPGLAVLNHYGPTETTVGVLTHRFGSAPEGPALPLGHPLANSRTFVVDLPGRLTPVGVPGELWIGGAGVSRGYLNRPDRTAERFVPDPFSGEPGERLYRTGDRVRRRPDGALEFLGRIDHQVKIRGFRIELGEIEAALERHPGVRESVVVAWGRRAGETRLAAYVVAEGVEAGELRRALRERLPDVMVPADFVFLDRLPLTPNGKVDRRALPVPDEACLPAVGEPASWAEELLAGFWAEVLGVERVGPAGDFFAQGGHSLLATQLMSRVRRAFGVELPLRTLFEAPTPALLAHRIAEAALSRPARPAPPLRPVPRDGALPLSFAQQRLWFIHQLDPGSASYNVPRAVRLTGTLRPEALEAALGEVARRHEVLRTTFPVADGRPRLEIASPRPLVLPRVDVSGLPDGLRETEVRRLAGEEARRPFDLGRGPLLRSVLVRAGGQEHVLLLTLHHIVSDGWSTGVLVREMGTLYRAFSEGRPSPLPELPLQYADFAHWQRQWLSGEVLENQLAYWRRQLAGLPDGLDLPLDRPRPALPTLAGDLRVRTFPAELRLAIDRLGRERGATFFMVMLAVFATLLSRLTRQTDVVAGSPIANRNRVEIEGLIGFFVNTLVLRVDTSGPPTFAALLERAREVALGTGAHQDLPFERLVEELAPERNLGRTPLFQVVIAVQNAPAEVLNLPGLSWEELPGDTRTANFDLTLRLFEAAGNLQASLEYKTALFDATTIDRLLGHLMTLAGAAVADPQAPVSRLPILVPAERDQLAREPLARVRAFPADDTPLHRLFERQAARTPDAVAVTGDGGRLTYAELDARADRLAARLRRLGVGPEVRVALWLDRTVELVVGILGVLKAGGAYVPVDPSYPEDRLRFLLEDAGAPVLVSVRELRSRLAVEGIATVLLDEDEGEPFAALPPVPDLPESTAYVIYTSGSTGTPKGVPVSHANVVRLFAATQEWFGFDATDVWTLFHSYAFDFSVWELWGALLYGGRLVVVPYWVSRSPEAFHALLAEEGVTVLNQTPSAFHQLAAVDGEPGARRTLALRWVVFGGEALEPRRLASWFARHGDRRPTLVNMYGITETTVHVTFRPLSADDLERGSVIGVPIPDTYLHILDPEGEPVPLGVPGEIHVGGAGLARGYLRRPELTAQRFVPDPFGPWSGARLYASGDLARRRPDGELEYLGRADQQVKIRGFRIEPGEIEAALGQHPAVREVVVLARGEGEKRLVAYLGVGGGAAPGADELRSFLAERLPEHMIPAVFVPLEALPLTAHGKVDRRALPEPEAARPGLGAGYAAPRAPEEAALAEVWAEVLEVDRVGVHDNFFALGGDSIRSIRVLSLAAERGLRFSLPQLFQHQTIAELVPHRLAEEGEEEGAASSPFSLVTAEERAALPEDVEDAYPLSALQLGMLFHSEYAPGATAYHNVSTLRLGGEVDPEALWAALGALAARHPVLRTSFDLDGFGRPLQLVHRNVEIPLGVEDLRALPAAEREERAARSYESEKEHRFDWRRAPLLRFHLQLLPGESQLTWAEHHAILDGWSVASLLDELFRLYLGGRAGELPPAPGATFRDFVALETGEVESEAARRFWREALRGAEPARLSRWPGGAQGRHREPLPVPVPEAVNRGLRELAEAIEVPLKSVLLAAHVAVLARLGAGTDVLTGLVVNGRQETGDADRALGLFLNTVPFRCPLPGESWKDLARRVLRTELDLLPHRQYPLSEIQRTTGGRALFDTAFNYVHFHVLREVEAEGGIEVRALRSFAETNFTLTADFQQDVSTGSLRLRLQHDAAALGEAQVRSIAGLYERALAALAGEPDGRWDLAGLLAPWERQQLLVEWNDTGEPRPAATFPEAFQAQAARTPEAVAVESAAERLTYRELEDRAGRLARRLRSQGVGLEVRVGLFLDRSPELVIALLAVMEAGGAYVPLDPSYPEERLAFLLEDSGVSLVLTRSDLAGRLPETRARVVRIDDGEEEAGGPLPGAVPPESLAYVLYTSGSTGRPKGVMVHHAGLANYLAWAARAYAPTGGIGAPVHSPAGFDLTVTSLLLPLTTGARVVLLPERPGAEALAGALRERKGWSLVKLTPAHLQWLEHELGDDALAGVAGAFVVGGEALTWEQLAFWHERAPGTRLINEYGPTETVVGCAIHEVPEGASGSGPVPIGRPIANARLDLLDRGLSPVPPSAVGEIFIGGAGVARGYLGRPDVTAERFVPDPFSGEPGARLYRTGDLASHLPDGSLEFLGRSDEQVKIRGYRIEPGEVEAALAAHPAVRQAAVAARRGADGELRLVAWVVPEGDLEEAALREGLLRRLPDSMLPSAFVFLDALPLSAHGKVDRRALPDPAPSARRAGAPAVSPRDETEHRLAALWEDLLGVSPLGVNDDFFALGGHSLLAVRLTARIERSLGVRLPISALVEAPTIERLAARLRGGSPRRRSPLVTLQPQGAGRPLFLVHPIGGDVVCYAELARRLGMERPLYGLQAVPDGETASLDSLASRYLEAVREVQKDGPYLLGGWSFGGTIAYEMARQLEAGGERVALLALVDVGPPERSGSDEPGDSALLVRLAEDLVRMSGREVRFGTDVLAGLEAEAGLARLLALGRSEGILPPEVEVSHLRELLNLFRRHLRAARNYVPGPYGGSVTLFRATGSMTSETADPTFGWGRFASIDLRLLDGDHYSVLRNPRVEALAEALRRRLEAAES